MIGIIIDCDWYCYWLLLNKFHLNIVHYVLYELTYLQIIVHGTSDEYYLKQMMYRLL